MRGCGLSILASNQGLDSASPLTPQQSVSNCFIRGSVIRYVQLPSSEVDTELLQVVTNPNPRPKLNQIRHETEPYLTPCILVVDAELLQDRWQGLAIRSGSCWGRGRPR